MQHDARRAKSRAPNPMLENVQATLAVASPRSIIDAASSLPSELLPALYSVLGARVELFAPPHDCSPALVLLAERVGPAGDPHRHLAQALLDSLATRLSAKQEASATVLKRECNGPFSAEDEKWLEATIRILKNGVFYPGVNMKALFNHYNVHYSHRVKDFNATQTCTLAMALSRMLRQRHSGNIDALTQVVRHGLTLCTDMSEKQVIYLLRAASFGRVPLPRTALRTAVGTLLGGLTNLDDKLFSQLLGALTYYECKELGRKACFGLIQRPLLRGMQALAFVMYVAICELLSSHVLDTLRSEGRALSVSELPLLSQREISVLMHALTFAKCSPASQSLASDIAIILQPKVPQLPSSMCAAYLFRFLKIGTPTRQIQDLILSLVDRTLAEQDVLTPMHITTMSSVAVALKREKVTANRALDFLRGNENLVERFADSPSVKSMLTLCVNLTYLNLQHRALLDAIVAAVSPNLRMLAINQPYFLVIVLKSLSLLSYPQRKFMLETVGALHEANAEERLGVEDRIHFAWVLMNERLLTSRTETIVRRVMQISVANIGRLHLPAQFEVQEMHWRTQVTQQWAANALRWDAIQSLRSKLGQKWRFGNFDDHPSVFQCAEQLERIVGPQALLQNVVVHPGIPVQCALLLDKTFQPVSWLESGMVDSLDKRRLPHCRDQFHLLAVYFLWDEHVLTTAGRTTADHLPYYKRRSAVTGATQIFSDNLRANNWHAFFLSASDWLKEEDKTEFLASWRRRMS